jgi:LuxR family maltose regulon positive regulatory protein
MTFVPPTKLRTPALPPYLVERAELLRELDAVLPSSVLLVCAPPGYGKSLLLAQWVARPSPSRTVWVTLDRADNDPRRLWSTVLAALAPHATLPVSVPAAATWSAAEHATFVARLVDELRALPVPVRLVLDDVDEITDPDALTGLRAFLRDRPAQLHVALSTTLDPPVGLNRLRLSAELHELRADRIRFTEAEAVTLLERAGLRLTPAQVASLHRRTGGWAAGLRLAAIALTRTPDPDRFIAEFTGDERCVADYLTGEVLNHLPAATLAFLRSISIADPVPSELAAELSGRADAGALLDQLEHETSLVSAVGHGRDTYRIQPLLRTYLLADLHRHGPKPMRSLHVAAARWWVARKDPVRALDHARRSADAALLSELVPGYAIGLVLSGDREPLRHALDGLGREAVARDPRLALVSAITDLEAGDLASSQHHLRNARSCWPADSPADLVALRGLVELLGAASVGRAAASTDVGPDTGDGPGTPELDALTRFSHGVAALLQRGDPAAARAELTVALDLAHDHGFDYLLMRVLTLMGLAAFRSGDLRAARETAASAAATAEQHDWKDSVWFATATAMLAFTELQRAEPGEAQRLVTEAVDEGPVEPPALLRFALAAVAGAAQYDRGDGVGGLSAMQQARMEFGDGAGPPVVLAATALLEFQAAVQMGRRAAAGTVRGWLAERVGQCAELDLMRAWAEAADEHVTQARELLRPVLANRIPALLPHTAVEAWLLESDLCAAGEQRTAARQALLTALSLAAPIDTLRPFAHACASVRGLLVVQQGSFGESNRFAARAAQAASGVRDDVVRVLSERELGVLAMLPSLLPLADIAADLTVSVNTVKSHVRSIYTKLGVSSRREAVLVAHERGLLSMGAEPDPAPMSANLLPVQHRIPAMRDHPRDSWLPGHLTGTRPG